MVVGPAGRGRRRPPRAAAAPGTHPTAPGAAPAPSGGPATTAPKSPPTTLTPTQSTVPQNLPKEAAPTREVGCPTDVPPSPAGGPGALLPGHRRAGRRGGGRRASPASRCPLPLPVPIVVPVVSDTGDSGSNDIDQRVTVYVDIDNQNVIDGDAYARRGQRALATLLLLFGLPALAILIVVLLRRRSGGGPAAPAGPGGWPTPPGAEAGPHRPARLPAGPRHPSPARAAPGSTTRTPLPSPPDPPDQPKQSDEPPA